MSDSLYRNYVTVLSLALALPCAACAPGADLGDESIGVAAQSILGTLGPTTVFDQPEQGWNGYTTSLADVNGDGLADLVWNQLGTINRTYVDLSNGNGTFRRALTASDQPEQGWNGYTQQAADLNGDGCADLVWNQLGTINRTYINLSNCNGTFRREVTALDQPQTGWDGYRMLVKDVSGDGRADVVWSQTATINRTYVALSQL